MSFLPPRSGYRLGMLALLTVCAVLAPPVLLRYMLPALSPFMMVCTVVATRALGLSALLGVPILVFVVWRRRGFCHYFCPVGWLVEVCAKTRPAAQCAYPRVPQIGQWLALLTAGGAIASLPLFLLLDPLALFSGAAGGAHVPFSLPQLAYAAGLTAVLVLSLTYPMLWCRRVCPLGASQDLLAELDRVFARRAGTDSSPTGRADLVLARRAFLGIGGGLTASALAVRASEDSTEIRLRPPGALDETRLAALCIRCGNCVRSCPSRIIRPDLWPRNATSLLVPELCFDESYCLETCHACGNNCPTGAIAALPLPDKNEHRIGLAQIDQRNCFLAVERECSACTLICPRSAIIEGFSRETYTAMVSVDAEHCNGCGACVAVCPPLVITIVPTLLV